VKPHLSVKSDVHDSASCDFYVLFDLRVGSKNCAKLAGRVTLFPGRVAKFEPACNSAIYREPLSSLKRWLFMVVCQQTTAERCKDRTNVAWIRATIIYQVNVSDILILSSNVKVVESARDLGVIIDSQLSLSSHVAALCRRSVRILPLEAATSTLSVTTSKSNKVQRH